jgi:AraC-like DNA-binding protein
MFHDLCMKLAKNLSLNLLCSPHDWASLSPELLWIFDEAVPDGKGNAEGERSRQISAWLVRKGWAQMEADGVIYSAKAGEWLICQGYRVKQTLSSDVHLLALRCQVGWPGQSRLFTGGPCHVFSAARYPILERASLDLLKSGGIRRWDAPMLNLLDRRLTYSDYILHEIKLMRWLESLFNVMHREGFALEPSTTDDHRLAACCYRLDNSPPGEKFPAQELMAMSGLSLSQLNRLSRAQHGCTLQTYRERRRLERATAALEDLNQPVKEIALDLGFKSLAHFSSWFKRQAGEAPLRFRKQHQKRPKPARDKPVPKIKP